MDHLNILQVVGFKNSGKTTMISRFIESATVAGKTVSVIKHHGHGGQPDLPDMNTDSMQFLNKGAASSLVYGDGLVQLHLQEQDDLKRFIDFSFLAEPDVILIEGFKSAPYPKIVLVREAEDWDQLKGLEAIQLIVTHEGVKLENIETIQRNEQTTIDVFFARWMKEVQDESI
ncbi:molybdopterin-guanine dinucleotide biosynthesis protein B [Planomicrobium sp. YIM 101495]|uniref:molybdopterin-guanine dinucleotide biosynthesis protein B n=1 Tax=Planomicrobium sp. YIM 101495 TaxID=2665160 RepID=UPI0012B9878C|nr:molybdopterin-guanine dinucleotide biosynthesis protein B [Planomicrobium sp. YIM 101495]MTD29505.1 molybdopterin-guanine dinucleotide biosynthesis protein B [Planomicrobium sp. YIM 101495]